MRFALHRRGPELPRRHAGTAGLARFSPGAATQCRAWLSPNRPGGIPFHHGREVFLPGPGRPVSTRSSRNPMGTGWAQPLSGRFGVLPFVQAVHALDSERGDQPCLGHHLLAVVDPVGMVLPANGAKDLHELGNGLVIADQGHR